VCVQKSESQKPNNKAVIPAQAGIHFVFHAFEHHQVGLRATPE
jgi:hypothetical protein